MPLGLAQSFNEEFINLIQGLRRELPAKLFALEGIAPEQLDINQVSKDFFARSKDGEAKVTADSSIDANANVTGRDVITFNYEVPKSLMKLNSLYNLWLTARDLFDRDTAHAIIEMELLGTIYINDAWDIGRPYCFNYSALDIALCGLKLSARLDITPPHSLSTFLRQVEQFMVYAANSTLGATGMADLLIVASWYVDKIFKGNDSRYYYDNHICVGTNTQEVWSYVAESLTSLIYTLNWEFRGNQSPFSNVSVYDEPFLKQLLPHYVIDGKTPELHTVQMMQETFLDCYNKVLSRDPITFPVLTACFSIKEGEPTRRLADTDFLDMVCQKNLPYGAINFYIGETSTLSSCCRLRSKTDGLGYANAFGAGSTKIGSLGVVTLNLPVLAWQAMDEATEIDGDEFEIFLSNVHHLTELAAKINHAKRIFIKDRIQRGSLPLYTQGIMDLKRQYSTCGFTGLYEALEILGYDMREVTGVDAAKRVLGTINGTNSYMDNLFGAPHNMEQVPGESSAVKLAQKDKLKGFNHSYDLYSNQFLPLTLDGVDVLDRLRIQGILDSYCTGGAICHINLGEAIQSAEAMRALVLHAAEQGVIYFAVNYALRRCEDGHLTVGLANQNCPLCGKEITETYTRVVGFLTNTAKWNRVRREEDWPKRVFYGKGVKEDANSNNKNSRERV